MKSLPLWCVVVALAAIPLTLPKPGLPLHLRAGEASNYLMARSLVEDGDLRFTDAESARLYEEFPYTRPVSVDLELHADDRFFAAPALYPALIALPVRLFGANGAIAFNMVCFLLALIVQVEHHRKRLGETPALAFVGGLFILSTAFAYIFLLRAEVMAFAGIAIALPLAIAPSKRLWRPAVAGLLFAPALVAVPATAMLLLAVFSKRRALKPALVLTAAVLAGIIFVNGLDRMWIPESSSLSAELRIESPLAIELIEPTGATQSWHPSKERAFITAFFGRYTGLLPYFPFAFVALGLACVGRERSKERLSTALVLLVSVVLISVWSPIDPGEQASTLGNPALVPLLPAFTLVVESLPAFSLPIAWAWSILFVGPMLSGLLGIVVPGGDVSSHTRSLPFSALPLEDHLLPHLHGYELFEHPQASVWAPTTRAMAAGDEIWILGGTSVELWLTSRNQSLSDAVIEVRTAASENTIVVRGAGEKQIIRVGEIPPTGSAHRLSLSLEGSARSRRSDAGPVHLYRFTVSTTTGRAPRWSGSEPESYYVGASLSFLGSRAFLERDVFGIAWLGCGAPPRIEAGQEIRVVSRLRNTSSFVWQTIGAARVRLGYRWVPDGEPETLRTDFDSSIEPQQEIALWQAVQAPLQTGTYTLELEPVFESVSWFSDRVEDARCAVDVEIIEPPSAASLPAPDSSAN